VAYVHFLPKLPVNLPHLPPEEKTFTLTKQVIPSLPEYTDTVVWKDALKPEKVILLRTKEAIPFTYENGILTISLPSHLRSASVDVVKVEFK